jgi:tRNA (Thr-GGU) A37 N-methylase/catechol 2,3-dioxygenase-like lactoylglutathione lyase family enzyme
MEILGLSFLGTSTPRRLEMATFLRDVLGLEPTAIEGLDVDAFRLPDGSTVLVTDEGEGGAARRTVGFEVADIDAAHAELVAAGIASEPEPAENAAFRYAHLRAPDGYLYELVERRTAPALAPIVVHPLGVVRSGRSDLSDDGWAGEVSTIELDPGQLRPEAVSGLDEFSHIEVVFHFDRVRAGSEERGARRPRGREDLDPVGILAQRGKRRPNRLGLSSCRLLSVDRLTLTVEGLDAIDGTPVLDVKPWFKGFEPRGETHEPASTAAIMAEYFSPREL